MPSQILGFSPRGVALLALVDRKPLRVWTLTKVQVLFETAVRSDRRTGSELTVQRMIFVCESVSPSFPPSRL